MTAISAISNLGQTVPWEYEGFKSTDASLGGTHIKMMFQSLTSPRSRNKLQASHVILGMYKALKLIAQESAFSEAYVILSLYGQRIGKVSFSRRVHGTASVAKNYTEITSVATDLLTLNGIFPNGTDSSNLAGAK